MREPDSLCGQVVEDRGGDLVRPEAPQICPTEVVGEDEQQVRPRLGPTGRPAGEPPFVAEWARRLGHLGPLWLDVDGTGMLLPSMANPVVRIHALSTGTMTSALGGFLEGEEGDLTYPVPVYVIEHSRGLVVVDSGLHPDLATDASRLGRLAALFTTHLPPDGSGAVGPLLRAAGFDPDAVAQVVLTHLHFDHAGGLLQLPNARLVVQEREWAARLDEVLVGAGAYHPGDYELGHDRLELDGDFDLFGDGTVTCLLTDGHTAGHQSVRARTEAGTFILCGDCCYLRRTLEDEHLPPFGADRDRQLDAIRRMQQEARDGATLVFGHDPDQWSVLMRDGFVPGI